VVVVVTVAAAEVVAEGEVVAEMYCHECKVNTHATEDCRKRARRLAAEAQAQAGPSQPLALTAPPVAVATPGAPADARDSAWKPGSKLHNQTSNQAQGADQNLGSVRHCDVCTKIAGHDVRHFFRTTCALADPSKRPPERLNSPHQKIRDEINRRRKKHGMGELPPFVHKNPRPTVGALISVPESSAEDVGIREVYTAIPDRAPPTQSSCMCSSRARHSQTQLALTLGLRLSWTSHGVPSYARSVSTTQLQNRPGQRSG
jgi:hypothetical protein